MVTFGPVPSRRLGESLGISLTPHKTCSYNCVYCQLGRTTDLRVKRESFFARDAIMKEIEEKLSSSKPDYLTFSGDGEPTLSGDIGWIIRRCKEQWNFPVAVLTNGSLLNRDEVIQDLLQADVVMPSLDAGSAKTFRKVNRPHRSVVYGDVLQGLVDFRREYKGRLWLEVMLVRGLNDRENHVVRLKNRIAQIAPDRTYVLCPTRPPAEEYVQPPRPIDYIRALKQLGSTTPIKKLESGQVNVAKTSDARLAILDVARRHPLRRGQAGRIEESLHAIGIVQDLCKSGELIKIDYQGESFLVPWELLKDKKDTTFHEQGGRLSFK